VCHNSDFVCVQLDFGVEDTFVHSLAPGFVSLATIYLFENECTPGQCYVG